MTRTADGFALDDAFLVDSAEVGDLALCHVRLRRDARFPWLILVPRRAEAREIEDLEEGDRLLLVSEIVAAGHAARRVGEVASRPVAKLNVGALGNITPRLHVHVVGRRPDDAAWPGPVWGFPRAVDYPPVELARAIAAAAAALKIAK